MPDGNKDFKVSFTGTRTADYRAVILKGEECCVPETFGQESASILPCRQTWLPLEADIAGE
ncbi:MAG: hypothetical protein E5W99_00355 [Mesorhizobium sp.]|nr:MAG: hypothetical protein E5W99_00355 [Mesorhizobium sp.]